MIRKHNNSLNVNIASLGTLTSALPAAGTVISAANLPAGAVVLVDNGMRLLNATTVLTASRVKVAQSLGATKPLVISHDFDIKLSKVSFAKHTRALEQITAIGYNPINAAGSLPSAANTTYYAELVFDMCSNKTQEEIDKIKEKIENEPFKYAKNKN